ncbi:hypothetical protein ACFVYF_06850 [Streptomyces sp. NPDC058274]|uniref:hypothetical protein n=1 Tax=Streptomyces sp. NPDC058274 TaxID=3346416 RepID=UPI0036E8BAD3
MGRARPQVWTAVVCHARSVGLERAVFLGDSVLPVDSPPGAAIPPGRVVRMHREPLMEFTELVAALAALAGTGGCVPRAPARPGPEALWGFWAGPREVR